MFLGKKAKQKLPAVAVLSRLPHRGVEIINETAFFQKDRRGSLILKGIA